MKIIIKIKFIFICAIINSLIFSYCRSEPKSNSATRNSNQNQKENSNGSTASNGTNDKQKKSENSLAKTLKKYQVGLMAKTPDGPLTEEDEKKALQEQEDVETGEVKKNALVGVVYISENLRNKKLGNFRIKSDGVHMLFPTDKNITDFQNFKDTDNFQNFMEKERIDFERNKLREAETNFTKNPYKEIYDQEKRMVDNGVFKIKNHQYKTHLMNLALEKEQEIYNNMVKNEVSEVKVKRYNKQIYNPIYRYNNFMRKS